jgi:hypothetical protein
LPETLGFLIKYLWLVNMYASNMGIEALVCEPLIYGSSLWVESFPFLVLATFFKKEKSTGNKQRLYRCGEVLPFFR